MNNDMVIACAIISMASLLMSSYLFAKDRARIEKENQYKGGNDK